MGTGKGGAIMLPTMTISSISYAREDQSQGVVQGQVLDGCHVCQQSSRERRAEVIACWTQMFFQRFLPEIRMHLAPSTLISSGNLLFFYVSTAFKRDLRVYIRMFLTF